MQKSLGRDSGCIIDSVIDHMTIIIITACSSYIKLPKELEYQKKDLISIQNIYTQS